MRWLLTVPTGVDLVALARGLAQCDAELHDEPVPLDEHEHVLPATGPPDLPHRIRQAGLPVRKASPDSDLTLYGDT